MRRGGAKEEGAKKSFEFHSNEGNEREKGKCEENFRLSVGKIK